MEVLMFSAQPGMHNGFRWRLCCGSHHCRLKLG
ncbi:unnamed protein product [Nezara viridula]|uniref:Uncharacterized protein n=1 Tax=Nezara viridula TaxID=85310 RepID=A0A9P0HNV1_NEZVI|nr:unnamed protein product [Nezara viridula]